MLYGYLQIFFSISVASAGLEPEAEGSTYFRQTTGCLLHARQSSQISLLSPQKVFIYRILASREEKSFSFIKVILLTF